ncbi:MAG: class I SAM-dependent methyltransferase [Candidatus Bathyarchaeum sp.]|nr:MAG: class I SAM-dependent methyltransferase [Candidatus Bathyarchaeum sp.]
MIRHTMNIVKEMFEDQVIVGAEVGVSSGHNAQNILQVMSNVKMLYLIDPYFGGMVWENYDQTYVDKERKEGAKTRLKPYEERIRWIYKEFDKCTIKDFEPLDFIYIDGDHGYEIVKKDLVLASTLVKKGGVIGGHDAGCLSIERAVNEFCELKKLKRQTGNNGFHMIDGNRKAQGWDWWFING